MNYDSGSLLEEYKLFTEKKSKPDTTVEDLRYILRYHWAYDQEMYAIEWQRVQMSLLILLSASTSSQPGAILENGCAKGSNRALRYRDVELMLFRIQF